MRLRNQWPHPVYRKEPLVILSTLMSNISGQLERKRSARYEQLRAGLSSDAAASAATDHSTELADLESRIETSADASSHTHEAADSSDVLLKEVEPEPIK